MNDNACLGIPLLYNYRPVLLPLRLAVRREYSSLMTVKRKKTFGRIRRSAMQLKWDPDQGTNFCHKHFEVSCDSASNDWVMVTTLFFLLGLVCRYLQEAHVKILWEMIIEAAGRPKRVTMRKGRVRSLLKRQPAQSTPHHRPHRVSCKLPLSSTFCPHKWNLCFTHLEIDLWAVSVKVWWAQLSSMKRRTPHGALPPTRPTRSVTVQDGTISPSFSLSAGNLASSHQMHCVQQCVTCHVKTWLSPFFLKCFSHQLYHRNLIPPCTWCCPCYILFSCARVKR